MIDVYWWSKVKYEKSEFENFGDILVPFILKKITTSKFRRVEPNQKKSFGLFRKRHYFIIGSIIEMATKNTVVWGAGLIKEDSGIERAKFLAVRGPLTRKKLLSLGYNVPERYGDPGILIRLFPQKTIQKKFKVGIIPHYVDLAVVKKIYGQEFGFKIIDVSTNDPQIVINEILECENIISSSLHGIIVSHALKVPAVWTQISDKLYGDNIKFKDYYQSLGILKIRKIDFRLYTQEEIIQEFQKVGQHALPDDKKVDKLIKDLIETCPFPKSKSFQEMIINYFSK